MNSKPKRRLEDENRDFQEQWETNYLITKNKDKLQCLVCMQVIGVAKVYNCKRHYTSKHQEKYQNYSGEARTALIKTLKTKINIQTSLFTKIPEPQKSALYASYAVSLELAKSNKPFSDGSIVKKCAIEMAKAFGDSKMVKSFETVSLSHQTIQRRVVDMGNQVEEETRSSVEKCVSFPLCLDESTDQTDVSQLLIFVYVTHKKIFQHMKNYWICGPFMELPKEQTSMKCSRNLLTRLEDWRNVQQLLLTVLLLWLAKIQV